MRIPGTVNFCLTSKTIRSKWLMGFLRFSRLKMIMRLKNRSRGMTTPNWTNMWLICNWCALWLPTVIFFYKILKTYNLLIKQNTLIYYPEITNPEFFWRKLVCLFSKTMKLFCYFNTIWMVITTYFSVYFDYQMKLHQKRKFLEKAEIVDSRLGVWSDEHISKRYLYKSDFYF